jgi:polysaccharide pyruvyl transferase WcaK-like protein
MRIFIVGMPGEGNLGDDLISALLIPKVLKRWPESQIGLLHGRNSNPFIYPECADVYLFPPPRRSNWKTYFSRRKAIQAFVKDIDLMLIGGGGLFQDSHYPLGVHKWMRYSFQIKKNQFPVWAVGVGFGPLEKRFSIWYLKKVLGRLSVIQVRDIGSQRLVKSLGFQTCIAPDIVAGSDLQQTPFIRNKVSVRNTLGCSIRPWPGLEFGKVVDLVALVCQEHHMQADLFVFEHAEPNNTLEYDYAVRLSLALQERNIETEVYCYQKDPMDKFAKAFSSVSLAIASRYHANILWQKLQVPVLPISYAPKVRRLYEENGGSAIPVDEIDLQQALKMFQRIPLQHVYDLPTGISATPFIRVSKGMRVFILLIDFVETLYGISYGLGLRLKRLLGSYSENLNVSLM